MSDRVRRLLLERVLDGTYPPGHRLVELHLASEFQTSQGPVREALRQLEALRIVETEPYRGTRVREVTDREMADAYEVRAVLEQYAAESAAKRLKGGVEHLRALASAIETASRNNDAREYASLDIPFHRAIVEAANNPVLLRTWESLGFELRLRAVLAHASIDLVEAQAMHHAIVDALEAGDGKRAGALLHKHLHDFIGQWNLTGVSPNRNPPDVL